jgi:hypothetical protein
MEIGSSAGGQDVPPEVGAAHHGNRVRVNVLCLVGATIGLASILLPWAGTRAGPFLYEENAFVVWIWNLVQDLVSVPDLYVAFLLFLGGTILAFLTSVGGIFQAIGLIGFYLEEIDRQASLGQHSSYEGQFAFGFYFAILSSALVLASIVKPLGIGFDEPLKSWRSRLKVITGIGSKPKRLEVLRALRSYESWTFAWGVTAILLVGIVIASGPEVQPREPMIEIEGGVMWVADFRNWLTAPYNGSSVLLVNNAEVMTWILPSGLLGGGRWASEYIGQSDRAGLVLGLTITDFSGDGRMGPGDSLVFTATNGTSFVEDVEYDVYFKWPGSMSYARLVSITFEFHAGELHSTMTPVKPGIVMSVD